MRRAAREAAAEAAHSPGGGGGGYASPRAAASARPRLLGLFAPSHMPYEIDRAEGDVETPTLAEMTGAALEALAPSERVFLLVERRIDHRARQRRGDRGAGGGAYDAAWAVALEFRTGTRTRVVPAITTPGTQRRVLRPTRDGRRRARAKSSPRSTRARDHRRAAPRARTARTSTRRAPRSWRRRCGGRAGRGRGGEPDHGGGVGGASRNGEGGVRPGERRGGTHGYEGWALQNAVGEVVRRELGRVDEPRAHGRGRGGVRAGRGRRRSGGTRETTRWGGR